MDDYQSPEVDEQYNNYWNQNLKKSMDDYESPEVDEQYNNYWLIIKVAISNASCLSNKSFFILMHCNIEQGKKGTCREML